jgi:ribosomal protein L7/L12
MLGWLFGNGSSSEKNNAFAELMEIEASLFLHEHRFHILDSEKLAQLNKQKNNIIHKHYDGRLENATDGIELNEDFFIEMMAWYKAIKIDNSQLVKIGEMCNEAKLNAVKYYMDYVDCNLKDAKVFIDNLCEYWPWIKAKVWEEVNNGYYLWDAVENLGDGPFTESQIKQLLKDGSLNLESRIKQGKDTQQYQPILSVREFQTGFEDFT